MITNRLNSNPIKVLILILMAFSSNAQFLTLENKQYNDKLSASSKSILYKLTNTTGNSEASIQEFIESCDKESLIDCQSLAAELLLAEFYFDKSESLVDNSLAINEQPYQQQTKLLIKIVSKIERGNATEAKLLLDSANKIAQANQMNAEQDIRFINLYRRLSLLRGDYNKSDSLSSISIFIQKNSYLKLLTTIDLYNMWVLNGLIFRENDPLEKSLALENTKVKTVNRQEEFLVKYKYLQFLYFSNDPTYKKKLRQFTKWSPKETSNQKLVRATKSFVAITNEKLFYEFNQICDSYLFDNYQMLKHNKSDLITETYLEKLITCASEFYGSESLYVSSFWIDLANFILDDNQDPNLCLSIYNEHYSYLLSQIHVWHTDYLNNQLHYAKALEKSNQIKASVKELEKALYIARIKYTNEDEIYLHVLSEFKRVSAK